MPTQTTADGKSEGIPPSPHALAFDADCGAARNFGGEQRRKAFVPQQQPQL
jgi:hypothetical protein